MTSYGPRFITPPADDQNVSPYRPIWRTFSIEVAILATIALILYAGINVFNLYLPVRLQPYVALSITLAPCIFWIVFSWWAEKRANQPRDHLLAVLILTMLAASGVGIPLVDNYFRVDTWLPLAPAVNRILGYTVTAGIVDSIIKYLVLRYTIWPLHFRERLDGVAYGIATGIGYATVLNLQFISMNSPSPPDIVAFHIFANYTLHIATGIVLGYGMSEVRFSNPTPVFMTIILVIMSIITGITIPIHAGLVNPSLSITNISAPKPLFGFGFSLALIVVISVIIAGLISNADRLEREARAGKEE